MGIMEDNIRNRYKANEVRSAIADFAGWAEKNIDSTGMIAKDDSITYSKLNLPVAYIVEPGRITLDRKTQKISTVNGTHAIIDNKILTLNTPEIDISAINYISNTAICYYNVSSYAMGVAELEKISDVKGKVVILFYFYQDRILTKNREGVRLIGTDGQTKGTSVGIGSNALGPETLKYGWGIIVEDESISINYKTKSIDFYDKGFHIICGKEIQFYSNVPSINISTFSQDVTYVIYYNNVTNAFEACSTADMPDVKKIILCYFYKNQVYSLYNSGFKIVSPRDIVYRDISSNVALFCGRGAIKFDFVNDNITFPMGFVFYKDHYYTPALQSSVIKITNTTDGIQGVYYNYITSEFIVAHYSEFASKGITGNDDILLIATFWYNCNSVSSPSHFKLNGKYYDNGDTPSLSTLDWTNNRFLFPDRLYFVKDVDYSIYAQNFNYQSFTDDDNLLFEMNMPTHTESFENTCKINSPVIGEFTTQIVGVQNKVITDARAKTVYLNICDKNKTDTAPKILVMGDSITNRNMPYLVKWWLEQWNIKPIMIGTMQNQQGMPATPGEGREGWRWTDYTYTTVAGTGTGKPDISSDLNNLRGNPFINPATNKFDFNYYMTKQNFPGVHYVTIMLGTNDINNYTIFDGKKDLTIDQIIQNMKDSFNTIEASIHAYNANIKIGLIPPIAAGISNPEFKAKQSKFIEEEIVTFKGKPNVYLLGNYLATGILSGKNGDDSGTVFSDRNPTRKVSLSGDVHDMPSNQYINALWSASWIMNMLK